MKHKKMIIGSSVIVVIVFSYFGAYVLKIDNNSSSINSCLRTGGKILDTYGPSNNTCDFKTKMDRLNHKGGPSENCTMTFDQVKKEACSCPLFMKFGSLEEGCILSIPYVTKN